MYEVGDVIACTIPGSTEVIETPVIAVDLSASDTREELDLVYSVEVNGTVHTIQGNDLKSPIQPKSLDFFEDLDASTDGMLSWRDGLELRPDNTNMPEVLTLLMAVQYDKEGHYGSSWKGKGEYRGIMANIDRKYDRLDKMTQSEIDGSLNSLAIQEDMLKQNFDLYSEQVGESKVDAIADLANYSILYLTYVKENYPLVFSVWVSKNVPKYLADKIPFLSIDNQG